MNYRYWLVNRDLERHLYRAPNKVLRNVRRHVRKHKCQSWCSWRERELVSSSLLMTRQLIVRCRIQRHNVPINWGVSQRAAVTVSLSVSQLEDVAASDLQRVLCRLHSSQTCIYEVNWGTTPHTLCILCYEQLV